MLELKNVIVQKVETMADGGLKLVLNLLDLPAVEKIALFSMVGKSTEEGLSNILLEPTSISGKSHSKRLKDVLYVLWKQGDQKIDAETFYAARMEQLIEQVKSKLD